jgi:hypothetical protein
MRKAVRPSALELLTSASADRANLESLFVFKTTRAEALTTARRLLRGYPSAPDPRRQVQNLYSVIVHAEGWSAPQKTEILSFGAWLQGHPNLGELKPRCESLLSKLG